MCTPQLKTSSICRLLFHIPLLGMISSSLCLKVWRFPWFYPYQWGTIMILSSEFSMILGATIFFGINIYSAEAEQMLPRQIPWRFALAEGKPFCHSDAAESRRQFGMTINICEAGLLLALGLNDMNSNVLILILRGSSRGRMLGHSLQILAQVEGVVKPALGSKGDAFCVLFSVVKIS